jgi:hypothetical protein
MRLPSNAADERRSLSAGKVDLRVVSINPILAGNNGQIARVKIRRRDRARRLRLSPLPPQSRI